MKKAPTVGTEAEDGNLLLFSRDREREMCMEIGYMEIGWKQYKQASTNETVKIKGTNNFDRVFR